MPAPYVIDKLETANISCVLHYAEHRAKEFTRGFDDAHGLAGITGVFQGTHSVC
jgi:hypothetical protein